MLSAAALTSIVCALGATILTMRITHNAGIGLLSPQAIGIGTAALVMIAFRVLAPSAPVRDLKAPAETVS